MDKELEKAMADHLKALEELRDATEALNKALDKFTS